MLWLGSGESFKKKPFPFGNTPPFLTMTWKSHPGPDTNIIGDVHTNGSLYTGHNSLTLSGKTTYTDTLSIGFMPGDSTHPETPTAPHWATGLPPASDTAQQPYGVALDDYHALIDYTRSSTPLDPYRLQMPAGYVVTIDSSNNLKIYNGSGTNITTALATMPKRRGLLYPPSPRTKQLRTTVKGPPMAMVPCASPPSISGSSKAR